MKPAGPVEVAITPHRVSWPLPAAIVVASLAIGGALLLQDRYESKQSANALWRIDRLSGEVALCSYGTVRNPGPSSCEIVSAPSFDPTKPFEVISGPK